MTPTFLSLFSGIGGLRPLDLGLERAGWECVGQVEIDPYCTRVLAKHWPDVPRWGDIKELDPDDLPRAGLIAGGFPCQPDSQAGKRQGRADDRWLWPEMARVIRHLRPRWVLVENVPGILARTGGMGIVLGDLASSGYDAEWDSIPAAAVGAPHQRDRVWIVAYPDGQERRPQAGDGHPGARLASVCAGETESRRCGRHVADTDRERLESGWVSERPRHRTADSYWSSARLDWRRPQESGVWAIEPDVGRVASRLPNWMDRLRALGNAVVPQVAELIGRRILEADAA